MSWLWRVNKSGEATCDHAAARELHQCLNRRSSSPFQEPLCIELDRPPFHAHSRKLEDPGIVTKSHTSSLPASYSALQGVTRRWEYCEWQVHVEVWLAHSFYWTVCWWIRPCWACHWTETSRSGEGDKVNKTGKQPPQAKQTAALCSTRQLRSHHLKWLE